MLKPGLKDLLHRSEWWHVQWRQPERGSRSPPEAFGGYFFVDFGVGSVLPGRSLWGYMGKYTRLRAISMSSTESNEKWG